MDSEERPDILPNRRTFRFAGVELKPGESPEDKIRDLARVSLQKNVIRSILIGVGLGLVVLYIEKFLADPNIAFLRRLPEPYPYLNHGVPVFLLVFYIGWALYWGAFDCLNADAMSEPHGLNRLLGGVGRASGQTLSSRAAMLLGGHTIGLAMYAVILAMICAVIIYSLLGGGIYGFYKLLRAARPPANPA